MATAARYMCYSRGPSCMLHTNRVWQNASKQASCVPFLRLQYSSKQTRPNDTEARLKKPDRWRRDNELFNAVQDRQIGAIMVQIRRLRNQPDSPSKDRTVRRLQADIEYFEARGRFWSAMQDTLGLGTGFNDVFDTRGGVKHHVTSITETLLDTTQRVMFTLRRSVLPTVLAPVADIEVLPRIGRLVNFVVATSMLNSLLFFTKFMLKIGRTINEKAKAKTEKRG